MNHKIPILRPLMILGFSSIAGWLFQAWQPHRLGWEGKWISEIGKEELLSGLQSGEVVFVDARTPQVFQRGHANPAMNVPAVQSRHYLGQIYETIASGTLVIVYGQDDRDEDPLRVVQVLVANGVAENQLRIFRAGWEKLRHLQEIRPKDGSGVGPASRD